MAPWKLVSVTQCASKSKHTDLCSENLPDEENILFSIIRILPTMVIIVQCETYNFPPPTSLCSFPSPLMFNFSNFSWLNASSTHARDDWLLKKPQEIREHEADLDQGHILYVCFEVTNDSSTIGMTALHEKLHMSNHMS